MKIHLLGPSGSGTSTVGRMLSERLKAPFYDSDDIFWKETAIPFSEARPYEELRTRLAHIIENNETWIICGSALKWGDILLKESDLIVLLYCEKEERLARLEQRESAEYGERIKSGGDMYSAHLEFMEWAAAYDQGGMDIRSKASEEAWLERAECPVLKITNDQLKETIERIMEVSRLH